MPAIDYPMDWAARLDETPFMPGSWARRMVDDLTMTIDAWLRPGDHWFAQEYRGARKHYTRADMESFWRCILEARRFVMARYLVVTGRAPAFNPALKMVRSWGV